MSYLFRKTLSERITATQRAFEFIAQRDDTDNVKVDELLVPLLLPFASDLERLKPMALGFPSETQALLEKAITLLKEVSARTSDHSGRVAAQIMSCLLALRPALDSVVEFNVRATGITERAFAHLQRLIMVDDRTREVWGKAFEQGETACEGIGATHLLMHGIWAFKAHAQKGRTDLVLGTPLTINDEIRRASEALVLTEWKKVSDSDELESKIKEAKSQVKDYVGGCLAGFELDAMRFLVMVSRERMAKLPMDIPDNDIVYRCINIAVCPGLPSDEARKQARGKHRSNRS